MIPNAPEPKLKEIYQEVILDHNRRPRNFHEVRNPTQYAHGHNPLCGDDYHLYLTIGPEGIVQEVGFTGQGCAISKSSSSIMTSIIKGKPLTEVTQLKDNFLKFMTQTDLPESIKKEIGRMSLFEGVKEFPIRVKCATLIWHTLEDALKDVKGIEG